MSEVYDLDALVPSPVTIKFDGKTFELQPPKTSTILRLGFLGQKLQDADKMTTEETETVLSDLTKEVYSCVPELEGKELNTAQLMKLMQVISEMGMPTDAKELKDRGITVDATKKAQ